MKNLKKVLSLVLALAMALSLMTAAFAADAEDFADYDKVSHKEAVDVMVALGVFNGTEGNKFAPSAELTREQAAKIITYMLLGQEKADKLTADVAPYGDVAATRWSAGAIAYCTNEGILAGSNGKFNPTGKLTGQAFAKMLLCALGYDAKIDGLEGSSWAINASKLAVKAGLDDKLGALSTVMTREEAAQMAFNAEKATMVEYSGGVDVKTSDGTTVKVGAVRSDVTNTLAKDYRGSTSADADVLMQFCEQNAKDLKLTAKTTDDFGAPANTWEYKSEDIGDYAKDAEFTFTSEVKKADMEKKLKGYTLNKVAQKNYVTDGKAQANADTVSDKVDTTDEIAGLTGAGITVKLYATNKEITNVVVINENLYKINKIDTKNDKVTLTAVAGKVNSVAAVEDDDDCYGILSNMKQDDYVIITAANGVVKTAAAAEKVTGKVTKVTTDSATLDGTTYNFNKSVTVKPAIDKDKTVNFYLDTFGNVIYTDAASNTDTVDTVYVVTKGTKQDAYGDTVKVMQAVNANGEVINAEYKLASSDAEATVNQAYTYEMDGDTYKLTAADTSATTGKAGVAAVGKAVSVDKKDKKLSVASSWDNYYASNVNFVYIDGTKSDLKASVKSGVQDVELAATDYVVTAKDKDGNIVVATVYVKGDVSTTSDNIVYVAEANAEANGSKLGDDNKTTLNGFKVYVNGEKQTIYIKGSTAPTKGFYTYTVNEKTGAWTLKSTTSGVAVEQSGVKATLVNGVYYIDGVADVKDFDATNATVVDVKNDPTKYESMADIKDTGDTGVTAAIVFNKDAKTVTTIYVNC